jgi:hypothetical protein
VTARRNVIGLAARSPDKATAALETRAAELARALDEAGYIVTTRGEIEAAAVARLSGVSVRMLRKWRDVVIGPRPSRTVRRIALYRLRDVLEWVTVRPDIPATIREDPHP